MKAGPPGRLRPTSARLVPVAGAILDGHPLQAIAYPHATEFQDQPVETAQAGFALLRRLIKSVDRSDP